MANTADVHRWRGPDGSLATRVFRFPLASRLDRSDGAGLHFLVADWPCASLLHTREQKNGLLESSRRFANKMERMRGRMERRGFGFGVSVRPQAATAPSTNTASKR